LSALHILGLGAALGAIILSDINVLRGAAHEQTALDAGARTQETWSSFGAPRLRWEAFGEFTDLTGASLKLAPSVPRSEKS
jgi:hypothetical protein